MLVVRGGRPWLVLEREYAALVLDPSECPHFSGSGAVLAWLLLVLGRVFDVALGFARFFLEESLGLECCE